MSKHTMFNRRAFFALLGLPALAQSQIQIDKTIVEKDIKETEATLGPLNGSNNLFALSYLPSSNASVQVYLNGLHQREGRDYTLSGKTLTLSAAPDANSTLDVTYRGEFNA